jgi:hypothetical protein
MSKIRQLASILLLSATLLTTYALAQTNLTQIRDTINNSDGTPFNGTLVITWNGYWTTLSGTISPLSTSARIYNGALSVLLVPTTTAAAGSYYQVVYYSKNGTVMWTETWQVPPSSNSLSVAAVRVSTTTGSGGSGGSGSTGGTGNGLYATLPISISQVTNLSSSLSQINSALTSLTNTVNGLSGVTPSTISFVVGETPSGTINGSNSGFTLSQTPVPASSLELYRNGLVQTAGVDYTLNGKAITFLTANIPRSGDLLQAYYRSSTGTSSGGGGTTSPSFTDAEFPTGTIGGANLIFTLAAAPNPAGSLKLYKNGMLLQQPNDYSLSGVTVTFVSAAAPQAGDLITAYYRH